MRQPGTGRRWASGAAWWALTWAMLVLALLIGAPAPAAAQAPARASSSGSGAGAGHHAAAPARKDRIVGVLDVRVANLSQTVAEQFEQRLEDQLELQLGSVDAWFASRKQMQQRLAASTKWSPGCQAGPCLTEVRVQTGAELVLSVYLDAVGSTYRYVITMLRTDTGAVVSQLADTCAVCTLEEALSDATIKASELLNEVPDDLTSTPTGAELEQELLAPLRARAARGPRRLRQGALVLAGLAVLAAGAGGYWASVDNDRLGRPTLGAAAGLAGGALLGFGLSFTLD